MHNAVCFHQDSFENVADAVKVLLKFFIADSVQIGFHIGRDDPNILLQIPEQIIQVFSPASHSSRSICSASLIPNRRIATTPKAAAMIMVMTIAPMVIAVIFVLNECKIRSFFQLSLRKHWPEEDYESCVSVSC